MKAKEIKTLRCGERLVHKSGVKAIVADSVESDCCVIHLYLDKTNASEWDFERERTLTTEGGEK